MASSARLDHIHGLRGLAAMVVVLQHAMQIVREAGATQFDPILHNINLGRFGVLLFFLISGLVVPFSFRGDRPLRNFLVSRFFRLYPLYWLSIPVLGVVALMLGRNLTVTQVLANLTMMQGFFHQADIGPGYWTLFLELLFYVMCCLLFLAGQIDRTLAIVAMVLTFVAMGLSPIVSALVSGAPAKGSMFPFFFVMFSMGMLFRRAFIDHDRAARWWIWILTPATSALGLIMSGAIVAVPDTDSRYFMPVALASASALPVIVFLAVLVARPRIPAWMAYLGTISYSVYLLQDVGLHSVNHLMPAGEWPFLAIGVVVAITLAISAVTYRFVEKPAIAIGRGIIHGTGPRASTGLSAIRSRLPSWARGA